MPVPAQMACTLVPAVTHDPRLPYIVRGYPEVLDRETAVALSTGELLSGYEDGEVYAFPGIETGMTESDWHFINQIDLPTVGDNFFKKAKSRSLLAPIEGTGEYAKHVLHHYFPDSKGDAVRFQKIVAATNESLRNLVRRLFPTYKFIGEDITWRFTKTESENIHFDSYGKADDVRHHVRLFVNFDTQPRLWAISHRVVEAINLYRDRVRPHRGPGANQFNSVLTSVIPWAECPRHFIAFAPGNAWLVNSQIVSHEIIFGRKLVACTFDVDPESMQTPAKHFPTIVEKALANI